MADPEKLNEICNESSPEKVSVTEKSTAAESSSTRETTTTINPPPRSFDSSSNQKGPSIPPRRKIDAPWISNLAKTKKCLDVKKQRIEQFRELVPGNGMSLQDIVTFLQSFGWDVDAAVNSIWDPPDSKLYSLDDDYDDYIDHALQAMAMNDQSSSMQRVAEAHIPVTEVGVPNLEGLSEVEISSALAMGHRGLPLSSVDKYQIGSSFSSSGLMSDDVHGTGDLHDVPITSSSQLQIQESITSPAQIREDPPYKVDRICSETGVSRYEALYYLKGFDWDLATAMEACRRKTLPPPRAKSLPVVSVNEVSAAPTSRPVAIKSRRIMNEVPVQLEQVLPKEDEPNAEKIKNFCDFTRAPPQVAEAYLNRYKWHEQNAINSFMEERFGNPNPQRISEDDHSTMGQNMSPPVPLMRLPSQSQFQDSGSSFSSFMDVDPTETEESLKRASDESVPVAIPPLPSSTSQVDRKLKGNAVKEDSSTEAAQAAPKTITMKITLLDGTEAKLPFRFNQTVRDIRNVIDLLRPNASRNYDVMSADKVEDLNTTVENLSKGSTSLVQVQRD